MNDENSFNLGSPWSRMGTIPLTALLPKLGELSQLNDFSLTIQSRLEAIQSEDDTGTKEDIRRRLGEEGMLMQILQWLNIDS